MFFAKVKATALAGLGVAVLGLAVGLWTYRPASADTRERQRVEGPAVTRGAHEGRPAKGHEPERPLGDWQRTTDECRITLHVEADHLSGTFRMADEGKSLVITARGDYSMTKDGVLYGVLTDVEIKEGREKDDEESVLFIDHPFSARYRVDGDVLIVKDLRFMEFGLEKGKEGDDFSLLLGRYKRKQPGGHADDE